MEEPTTVERNEPAEPGPTMQGEVDAMETPTMAEQEQDAQQSNEAPTNITPSLDHNERVEPNILDILEDRIEGWVLRAMVLSHMHARCFLPEL